MANLKGKVAVVTGAARGIGAAIATKLAEAGADVAICDLKAEWCDETVKVLESKGVKAKGYGVNVAASAEVDACVKAGLADFGRIDIMVNNAGITKDGLLMRMRSPSFMMPALLTMMSTLPKSAMTALTHASTSAETATFTP